MPTSMNLGLFRNAIVIVVAGMGENGRRDATMPGECRVDMDAVAE
jgi:hypothetical protein